MSAHLPRGIRRVASGRDLNGAPVVRIDVEAPLLRREEDGAVAIVGRLPEMRVFCALVLRQIELTERGAGTALRLVVGEGE